MRNLFLLLMLLCANALHAENAKERAVDPGLPGLEWISRLASQDTSEQALATRQLKKLGVKGVPAMKAALERTEDEEYKTRLTELVQRYEGAGEAVNGLAVKVTAPSEVYAHGMLRLRVVYLNQTEKPLVVRVGVCTAPPSLRSDGVPLEKNPNTPGLRKEMEDAIWEKRTREFQGDTHKPLVSLIKVESKGERKIFYTYPDGKTFVMNSPRVLYAEVPALGLYEETVDIVVNTRTEKSVQAPEGFEAVHSVRLPPCLIMKVGTHGLRVSVQDKIDPDEPKPEGAVTYSGIGTIFKSEAARWTGEVASNAVQIEVQEQ